MTKPKTMNAILLLLVLLAFTILISLSMGETWINPFSPESGLEETILWQLRLPRLITAFAVGGMLALAGAWFQVLLGNPLAEPYVLGVAGSSAVGAVLALILFPNQQWAMSPGAFIGAWVGIALVLQFSHLGPNRLLLAGVVLAAFWSAIIALLLSLMPNRDVAVAFSWMMGDLTFSAIPTWLLLLGWLLALGCGIILSSALDRLLLGEMQAIALGVDVPQLRRRLLLLASAVTAIAVTAAGTIGFVGLVIPHLMRLLFGAMHRHLIPASAISGGILLVLADSGARTLIAPGELPVGVVTAMIGVPLFLWLLLRQNSR